MTLPKSTFVKFDVLELLSAEATRLVQETEAGSLGARVDLQSFMEEKKNSPNDVLRGFAKSLTEDLATIIALIEGLDESQLERFQGLLNDYRQSLENLDASNEAAVRQHYSSLTYNILQDLENYKLVVDHPGESPPEFEELVVDGAVIDRLFYYTTTC